ncbi:probable G-protein coupled receptor 149 [Scleropages formosus]|uniref:G protein-coupled receptor 149 n=1 Tax=Scleropages formosus TaxID=113540 RepID=A0A8C9SNI9_SCLFO|nr:probable G-protein coupled receptor 149 [Scleropages formosus]
MGQPDMSAGHNGTELLAGGHGRRVDGVLLGFSCLSASLTLAGGLYSLACFLRMRTRTSLSLIVAAMSVDDLVAVAAVCLFALGQWHSDPEPAAGWRCTLSALLYVFQCLSSNMKASLMVAHTFHGTFRDPGGPPGVPWAIGAVWGVSLAVSALPVCGWGSFSATPVGCFAESAHPYALLLCAVYLLCFCTFVAFSVPLAHRLLCSGDPHGTPRRGRAGAPGPWTVDGAAPLCEAPSPSRDSLGRIFETHGDGTSEPTCARGRSATRACPSPCPSPSPSPAAAADANGTESWREGAGSALVFAQRRFSFVLAMARILLWMPMMIHVFVSHVVPARRSAFQTPSFLLTFVSTVVTPLFFLSKRWIHLPCGCFINCRRDALSPSSAGKKRGFDFNLSFQQGYGIYKISQAKTPCVEKPPYHSLLDCDSTESRAAPPDGGFLSRIASTDFRTTAGDSAQRHGNAESAPGEERADRPPRGSMDHGPFCGISPPASAREENNLDTSSVFEGPERRLSHGECRKIELTDWEWCRSKSERTPRQRSGGGLAIPLCAIQGTVSLHAPTGKTLSLSTYEVSSDGLKISPNTKKVEVYRSKSVGHEPRAEEPSSGDTNVKIHLEVLEICDNEEAMDSVSIVSNISQSSAHARSPSLRYSRRENRFVSCDLGETASYSLLIPTCQDPDMNIHIPDTVEAHRRNSRKQQQQNMGYQEEIQLLNEAYRRQEGSQVPSVKDTEASGRDV